MIHSFNLVLLEKALYLIYVPTEETVDNKIGNEGAKAIADVLKANDTLTKLDLTCDKLT